MLAGNYAEAGADELLLRLRVNALRTRTAVLSKLDLKPS